MRAANDMFVIGKHPCRCLHARHADTTTSLQKCTSHSSAKSYEKTTQDAMLQDFCREGKRHVPTNDVGTKLTRHAYPACQTVSGC